MLLSCGCDFNKVRTQLLRADDIQENLMTNLHLVLRPGRPAKWLSRPSRPILGYYTVGEAAGNLTL